MRLGTSGIPSSGISGRCVGQFVFKFFNFLTLSTVFFVVFSYTSVTPNVFDTLFLVFLTFSAVF